MMSSLNLAKEKIGKIEKLIAKEVGRNIREIASYVEGDLFKAAQSILSAKGTTIILVTGFYIPKAEIPAAETDGPIGTAHLAKILNILGYDIIVVTDDCCKSVVSAALDAVGVDCKIETCSVSVNNVMAFIEKIISSHDVSHAVFVERVGSTKDGKFRNMRALDIGKFTAPLDLIALEPSVVTIGIGDGGNEVGMGKVPFDIIANSINKGDLIACRVTRDFLIVAGVSNWGAIGLVASLAIISSKESEKLLHFLTPQMDKKILKEIVYKGPSVDGVSGKQEISVDGMPWEIHGRVIEDVLAVLY